MNKVVEFALRQRMLVVAMLVLVLSAGAFAFTQLNIEAYPDPVPPMVDIITQSSGQSAEEIERYITIPIEVQMSGIPHTTAIRTISMFGLSDVKLQFTYDFTYDEAQQWVINRLSQLGPLPTGATPSISPSSPTGEIYRYRLVGPRGYPVRDLKTLQDWVLERRFKALPGVIDVTGWGGETQTYDVTVDLPRLVGNGLTLAEVLQALNNSNLNVGGQTVNIGSQSAAIRGVGLIHSLDQIRSTMIANNKGSPVLVSDIAKVSVGNQPRLGIAGQDNDNDIVEGIVLMRRGEESTPTIQRVESEVQAINSSGDLPPDVHIERIYDRSDLIHVTTATVVHNMVTGILLIFLVQWLFLGNLRSAVIVAATIPFALSIAILIMIARGESANLLSVGAIDFGLVVDATVIMMENVFRHLSEPKADRFVRDRRIEGLAPPTGLHGKLLVIARSAVQVNRAIFFSAAIIIAGFIPLFTMTGVEGHIFGPMARTYAYAIAGGLLATFTVSPALASLLLPEQLSEEETFLTRWITRFYRPISNFALDNRVITLGLAAIILVAVGFCASRLGSEFLPHLEEGNLWIRATMPGSVSLEASDPYVNRMRRLIANYPEVQTVVSQHGRPDDGTDTSGFFNAEFFAPLQPADQWPAGMAKDKLVEDMTSKLKAQFPGVEFGFSQYIQDNVAEAASGVKGENSIKLFGNDLKVLEEKAGEIQAIMAKIPGIADLSVFQSLGQPTVQIDVDRARAARYGLTPGDINSVIQTALGGQAAGNLYEPDSDRNFPIMVRLAPQYRQSFDSIGRIPVGASNPSGGTTQIPLADVADIRLVSGAAFIYREGQQRYIPIKFSVRDRDLGSAVEEAQAQLAKQLRLPPGYHIDWAGEFGQYQEAVRRLAIIVPLSVLLIGVLLYANFGSVRDALLAGSVIPMAMIGGLLTLFMTGTPFSISAAIGFVALFGIAAMDGIIVVSFFNRMVDEGLDRASAVRRTCAVQMRPVLMTCVAAGIGLLPAAFSTGIGSQVQKPLALVVVGGISLAPAFILLVLPVLISLFSTRAAVRSGDMQETGQ